MEQEFAKTHQKILQFISLTELIQMLREALDAMK